MFQVFADWLTYLILGLAPGTHFGESVNFFFYELSKIYVLVFLIIALIAFLRTFFAAQKIKALLVKQKFGTGNTLAALFGAVTPFCSCSSIPLFIGFLEAEVPLGMAFSFLITSPLVNEVVFILMGGTFGWSVAFCYALSGIILGIGAGVILGKLKLNREVLLKFQGQQGQAKLVKAELPEVWSAKFQFAYQEARRVFKKLWLVIVLGVGIGAMIHGYVPQEFFAKYLAMDSFLAVPIAVLLGLPIYAGCSTLVPIIFSLTMKGVPLGVALAFMMSIAGLSLPEAIMLKRVLSFKLLTIFFGIVALGILMLGYLFLLFG